VSSSVFCDECGALNPAGADECRRCHAPLYPETQGGSGEDDGFRVVRSPATRPLTWGRARRQIRDLDEIPVAPRRSPVGTNQQLAPPPIPAPKLPDGAPKAPKPPKVEPPRTFLDKLFKPAPARKEGGKPPGLPKGIIAVIVILVLVLCVGASLLTLKIGPFDDAPLTATISAERGAVATQFAVQTQQALDGVNTVVAVSTTVAAATQTVVPQQTGTAVAVERAATEGAIGTAFALRDEAATAQTAQFSATQAALAQELATSKTEVAQARAAAATAGAASQATAGSATLQNAVNATMNAVLTRVAPPPAPRNQVAPPPVSLAPQPSLVPVPGGETKDEAHRPRIKIGNPVDRDTQAANDQPWLASER
jgi:hypothetical protein